jgi:hypothetical protein
MGHVSTVSTYYRNIRRVGRGAAGYHERGKYGRNRGEKEKR